MPDPAAITLTPGVLDRFLAYAKDAVNWGGTPLVGGNVGGDPADKGYIVNMKTAGLVTSFTDRDRRNGVVVADVFLTFTDAGRALALQHGIDI